jgi:phage tail sheath protein FI
MPTYTFPGIYVEEIPSGVRTITGVSTSDTAFVDFFPRGPVDRAVRVTGMQDFARRFGGDDPSGLHAKSESSYAIRQFFLNGGQVAWVVRVATGAVAARLELNAGTSPMSGRITLEASSPGVWGLALEAGVDHEAQDKERDFNLVVREVRTVQGRRQIVAVEVFRNLSTDLESPRSVKKVVDAESELVRVENVGAGGRPAKTGKPGGKPEDTKYATDPNVLSRPAPNTPGDETWPFIPFGGPPNKTPDDGTEPKDVEALEPALIALGKIAPNVFNLLCLPWAANLNPAAMVAVLQRAAVFCTEKRAFLLVDPPKGKQGSLTLDELNALVADGTIDNQRDRNAAMYFPRVLVSDPLNENRPRDVGPSGTLAGVYARTDATRGVWKAPAGIDARLLGATLQQQLTDRENGGLNPLGINVLRTFPIFGNIAWGARTLEGADQQASEWKYVPVRRTALFLEESFFQGLKWVVFEPNDEGLWAQIRLNVGAFMQNLFRQGAFQGNTPAKGYFVKCDSETTTQNDIDLGVVNIVVGFAPLKPAEFVVIQIQQMAGQIDV